MQLIPYFAFDGQCEAAFNFYATELGGQIVLMTKFAGSPMAQHVSPERQDKIMHARMTIGTQTLMGSDAPPDQFTGISGSHVAVVTHDPAEAAHMFDVLARDGTVQMALQKTFWSDHFGMLTDKFGVPWLISHEAA